MDAAQAEVTLYGFPGTASGIDVSGERLTIKSLKLAPPTGGSFYTPKDKLPSFNASPIFRDVSLERGFKAVLEADCSFVVTADPFGGEFREGGINIVIDGWGITAERLSIGPKGLSVLEGYINARFEEGEETGEIDGDRAGYASASAIGLTFDSSWTPVPGKDALLEPYASVTDTGYFAVVSMALKKEAGLLVAVLEAGKAKEAWQHDTFFERIVLDGYGKVVSSTMKADPIRLGTEDGFRLEFIPSALGELLVGTGSVRLSDALGGTGPFRTAPDAIRASTETGYGSGYFEVEAFSEPVSLSYKGWDIVALEASLGGAGEFSEIWSLLAGRASVRFRGTVLTFENLAFSEKGYLIGRSIIAEPVSLPIFGGRLLSIESVFDDDGLSVLARAEMPTIFIGNSVYFGRINLSPDGSFEVADQVHQCSFGTGLGHFVMEGIWLDDEGLKAESMMLRSTWSPIASTIRMYGVAIANDGSLKVHTVDPFSIGAYGFFPGALTSDHEAIHIQGTLHYPRLGAISYALHRDPAVLTLPYDGSAPSLDIPNKTQVTLPYGDSSVLIVSGRSLVTDALPVALRLDGVVIHTPKGKAGDAILDNVRITQDGTWDMAAAVLKEPFTWKRDGIVYELESLHSLNAQRALFTGIAAMTGPAGTVARHGCAVAFYLDGSVTAAIADGTEVTWYEWN